MIENEAVIITSPALLEAASLQDVGFESNQLGQMIDEAWLNGGTDSAAAVIAGRFRKTTSSVSPSSVEASPQVVLNLAILYKT